MTSVEFVEYRCIKRLLQVREVRWRLVTENTGVKSNKYFYNEEKQ